MRKATFIIPAAVIVIALVMSSLFIVDERQRALVLRFGQSAEVLAWGILFVVMPLSGIFYPVDALPTVLQPVSILLPTTHAFAAVRTVLDGDPMPWDDVVVSAVGCVAVALLGLWFVARMLKTFRQRGYITRFS